MTMMMTNSQFGLDDMEALLWGPSSPMADAMDSLYFRTDTKQQDRGGTSLEGDGAPASPLASSSLSSSSSPSPFYSPPPSPLAPLLHVDKGRTESDPLSLPWVGDFDHLRCNQVLSGDVKEDQLPDLDWMAEKMALSGFDLDSLMGSCSPTEGSPSSSEHLLASFDCPMALGSLPLSTLSTPVLESHPSPPFQDTPSHPLPPASPAPSVIVVDEPESCIDGQEVPSSPLDVPGPQEEVEIKSEPASPGPSSPVVDSPSFPANTLDLGSEVDVSESEVKPVVASVVPPVPRIVLSLSPTRILLVLAPKNGIAAAATSEVIHCSPPASPPQTHSRSRPYPEPKFKASPPSPAATSLKVRPPRSTGRAERAAFKTHKDKKQKKMEQNKTAATRYRQKKRAEQDALLEEHSRLEKKNMELTEKVESMAREIEYLKELMEEVQVARLKKGRSADQ
ncbi:activating transcription factor 4b [Pholidichthys leucotaenia]